MSGKKLLRSSFLYVVLGFLPMAVNFLLTPLYSHVLTPEQNALLGQAAIFQGFLGVFVGLSIDSAFTRLYFDYYKDDSKLKEYTSSVLIFILLFSSFTFLVMLLFGNDLLLFFQKNKSFTFSRYGIWVFVTTLCVIIQSVFLAYYRNGEKILMFSLVSLLFFFSSLALTLVGLLVFKAEALGSIVGRAIAYLGVTVVFLFIFFSKIGFTFKLKYIKESLRYSLPIVPYLLLMTLYGNIDRILIERYFSMQDLGIYNFAFVITGAVSVFISSGQNVLGPIIYRLLGEEVVDEKKVNNLFRWFHYLNTAIISIGLSTGVVFIQIFISSQYQSILNYIGVLFLAYIFRVYYLIYVDGLFFYKKTRWISLITLGSFLIGLLSNYFLIPAFGILGVCISVLAINLAQAAGAYLQLILYKLNMNFYLLNINHLYTILVISGYFICLFILRGFGQDIMLANFIPLLITVVFSTFFLYKNRQTVTQYIHSLVKRR